MKLYPIVDFDILQVGDIVLTTSDAMISELIRSGEEFSESSNLIRAIAAYGKDNIPSHSLMIYDPIKHLGFEQTWPIAKIYNLDEYKADGKGTHFIGVYRCPWLDDKHNLESAKYLRDLLYNWMTKYISEKHGYGALNFPAFLTEKFGHIIPEDKKHQVCSMVDTLALIKCVYCEGYDLNFPEDWIVSYKDNQATVGLVSPLDQDKVFNNLGWSIPFKKYIRK